MTDAIPLLLLRTVTSVVPPSLPSPSTTLKCTGTFPVGLDRASVTRTESAWGSGWLVVPTWLSPMLG